MIDALKRTAAAWLQQQRPARVVQVLQARGSVPREAGTRMLVAADAVAGTIGGGHLELQAIARARQALARGDTGVDDQTIALGPTLGQCCGGALTLRCAPLDVAALAAWPDETPLFTLQLYGAGHVGRAIVRLLETLPCAVQWIDEREDEFPPEPSAPHIQRLCDSHDLDLALTEAIARRGDFAYLGLIGSATKRARFFSRLAQRGIGAAVVERITCPIGVPGIPGKQPEVLAVAVVAQLLQVAAECGSGDPA
ncbi:MAG: xanthine dehydrogenase accessory protein XdhC [Burkholderiales bacterium PBB5]|nr:MAG: xanthine dehydrogenase accessory protein XdhC [Burkholderiales bacterium PBB5]